MGENLHHVKKYIELFSNKHHRVNQWIEEISVYIFLLFSKNGKHTSYHYCYAYYFPPLLQAKKYPTYYYSNPFDFFGSITTNILLMQPIFCLFPTISFLQIV